MISAMLLVILTISTQDSASQPDSAPVETITSSDSSKRTTDVSETIRSDSVTSTLEHRNTNEVTADSSSETIPVTGLSPLVVGILQGIVGGLLFAPAAVLSIHTICVGPLLCAPIAGLVVAWIGDALGTKRGSIIWPSAAIFVAGVVSSTVVWLIAAGAILYVIVGNTSPQNTSNNISDVMPVTVLVPVVAGIAIISAISSGVAGAIAYNSTSEDRRPGDDGHGLPGVFSPEHREPKKEQNHE